MHRAGRGEEERGVDRRRLTVNFGNGGNSALARAEVDEAGLIASTADVSAALACRPFSSPKYSADSSARHAIPVVDRETP